MSRPHTARTIRCCFCKRRPSVQECPLCFGCREIYESGAMNALPIASSPEEYQRVKGMPYRPRSAAHVSLAEMYAIESTGALLRRSCSPAVFSQIIRNMHSDRLAGHKTRLAP